MQESRELAAAVDAIAGTERGAAARDGALGAGNAAGVQPPRRNLVYRAARKAYRLLNRPQIAVSNALRADLVALQGEHAALRVELAAANAAIANLDLPVAKVAQEVDELAAAVEELGGSPLLSDARVDRLYEDFEREFRGSFEEISARVAVYLEPLRATSESGAPVLDVGSGRGEWLDVLRGAGIEARGVDVNSEFVNSSTARGLDVELMDAFAYLQGVATASLGTVTAFHLVEHLDIRRLVELVDQAARVLRPGGLLILETPNPTNLNVGASSFFRDPTHRRPVHPDFLTFLVRECGFASAELRYLHPEDAGTLDEHPGALGDLSDQVRWALLGPQDYAVIATKA